MNGFRRSMRVMRPMLWIPLFVALIASGRAVAPHWPLPPIEGQLSGDFTPSFIEGAPPLHWSLMITKAEPERRHIVLILEGAGTRLRAEADVNLRTELGTWKITEGTFDLAQWNDALTHWLPATAGLIIPGTLSLTGSGAFENGTPTGEVNVALRNAAVRNPKQGWALEGVSLGGRFAVDAAAKSMRSTDTLTLAVQTITTKRFGARNLSVYGSWVDERTFALKTARIEIAGGDMTAAPTTIALQPVRMVFDVTINRIGLQDVVALVPTALASARGRVDGTVRIGWNSTAGLELGHGHLLLRPDEPAEVTLKPFPGLFTSAIPRWLLKLPERFVKWSVPSLRKAELGQTPIEAQSLDVTFSPEPDAEGRTAVVRLTGTPRGAGARTPVDITAGVYGSLQPLIHLGTSAKFSVGIH